tara:strand:- start:10367 stop:10855 length:489 start_codon:yes stop_codon:yes gene_type:complete
MANKEDTTNKRQKTVTLMMGGPASGKSTVHKERYPDALVIDCDTFKEGHPDYDPKNPAALHVWSSLEATKAFHAALAGDDDFIFDGTGANAEKYVTFIAAAQGAGWHTRILYVACDLATALERNAGRDRVVGEDVVREKYSTIATSYEIVSRYVDEVVVVNG